jgi:diacylglycerol kinase
LFNTAIEKLADEVDPKWNERIGQVKDYAAGAVLVSALMAIIVGALVFIPKIVDLF